MAAQPENLDELLCSPAFSSYDNVLATHLTNRVTVQGFEMDNLGMMDVKTLNSVFRHYKKKSCANAPRFLAIKIQQFLALHRNVQGRFLYGQAVTSASILPTLSKIDQDYMAASDGIGAEDKDAKSTVTTVIFNFLDKVIPFLVYWAVVLASMKPIADNSKLDYLLRSRRSYTLVQRDALVTESFKDSVSDI